MNPTDTQAPRPRRWRKIVAVQLLFVILGAAALEIGSRIWLWHRGAPYDAAETRREARQLIDLNQTLLPRSERATDAHPGDTPERERALERLLHPYLGWELAAGYEQVENEYQWLHSTDSPGAVQIVLVGGSVAANFGLETRGWERLRKKLIADPRIAGRVLHFMMFARGGFKEPQQVNFVNYLIGLGFKPDVVINIDGFNEVALGNNNKAEGTHPVFPSAAHWGHLAAWSSGDRAALDMVTDIRGTQRKMEEWDRWLTSLGLDKSCVLGKLAVHRMYKLRSIVVEKFGAYSRYLAERSGQSGIHGPPLEGGEKEAIAASVECWKQSSRCIADICRARGIIYIHVLQPTLHDTGSKPLTAKEIATGKVAEAWSNGAKLGYPLLRAAGQELAKAGVEFIDASMLFEKYPDDLYFDCCHFTAPGHELLADKLAPVLLERMAEKH